MYHWGIDMGGTKIEGVIIRKEPKLEILQRIRVGTEQEFGYDHVLGQFKKLVTLLREKSGLRPSHIGVGTPGTIDSVSKVIKNSNTQCIVGKPMVGDLQELLDCRITMANDANCFAMAEASLGIVPDYLQNPEVVFGVIMGTGVGSGVVVNGKVINGRHGIAGEWGHNRLAEEGPMCYCGHNGCVETFISGPACQSHYKNLTGQTIPMAEIYSRYLLGEPEATQTVQRLVKYFGKAVAIVINLIDPDAIVLGGGLGNLDVLYDEGKEEVKKHLFNKSLETLFLKPKLGDSAGVIGAALL
ncbi:MAG: ROK family protein [Saprospiraceae bacterium]|nr:ROK family protein [Saprospiraceae bacterium]